MDAALKLYELMNSKEKNIGKQYNEFQIKQRNILWKDIIPQYLYPISDTLIKCKKDINCIYEESNKTNDLRTSFSNTIIKLTGDSLYSDLKPIEIKLVNYKQKYLKYKNKYLKLKNQLDSITSFFTEKWDT